MGSEMCIRDSPRSLDLPPVLSVVAVSTAMSIPLGPNAPSPGCRTDRSAGAPARTVSVQVGGLVSRGAGGGPARDRPPQPSSTWVAMSSSSVRGSHHDSWSSLARRKYSWMSNSTVKPMPPKICWAVAVTSRNVWQA